ncbi:MAG: holin-like protein [Caballeronia sp.]|nr:holin-like protein [Caballeronia sp.]
MAALVALVPADQDATPGVTRVIIPKSLLHCSTAWLVKPHSTNHAMLRALATLLLFQCFGEGLSMGLHVPVPGPVIGLLLLFGYLLIRPSAVDSIEPTALELLRHLSLLFVPAGVGIMVAADKVRGEGLAIAVALVVSTTLAIAVTALVTRALMRRQMRRARVNTPSEL